MITRRQFMQAVAAGTAGVGFSRGVAVGQDIAKPQSVMPRSASDLRPLGQTGLRVSVLGMGTGTNGWGGKSNQTRMGREALTQLLRHAIDRGVTYIDCADQYGSHTYLRDVLRAPGVDRGKLFILSKTHAKTKAEAVADIERFRDELGADQLDCLLLHCMTGGDWVSQHRGAMDAMAEAKSRGVVRALGVSCHGWDPLVACREPEAAEWLDVQLARINPFGSQMDGRPAQVEQELAWMRDGSRKKRGVLGMKVFGGGKNTGEAERETSLRYVLGLGTVDAFTIGFESIAQFDQTFELIDRILKS